MNLTNYTEKILLRLSNNEAGEIIHALLFYNSNNNIDDFQFSSESLHIVFDKIIEDIEKKNKISKIRSIAGKKGMKSRYNTMI